MSGYGTLPFKGEHRSRVDGILHKAPTALVRLNSRNPAGTRRIIGKALEKGS